MISLATPSAKSPSSLQLGEAKPAAGDASTGKGGFSALLGGLAHTPSGNDKLATPAASKGKVAAAKASGAAVPEVAESGRILPAQLPDLAGAAVQPAEMAPRTGAVPHAPLVIATERAESEDAAAEPSIDGEKPADAPAAAHNAEALAVVAAVAAVAAGPQVEPLAFENGGTLSQAPSGDAKPALVAKQPIPQSMIASDEASNHTPAPQPALSRTPPAASVALAVAAEPHAPADGLPRPGVGGEADTPDRPQPGSLRANRAAEASFVKAASAEPQAQPRMEPAAPVVQAALSLPSPAAENATRPALHVEALQDLTRIVDRLAAAREAFMPATAAMAVSHAEFGELSLRFDQHREGQLAVQLSASDPDAHRAIAAAVADRPFAGTAENQAGAGQPNAQSQGQARGAPAGRDGDASNGNASRHHQPQQRGSTSRNSESENTGQRRAGIFA